MALVTAVAWVQSLARELPHPIGTAGKNKKQKTKTKTVPGILLLIKQVCIPVCQKQSVQLFLNGHTHSMWKFPGQGLNLSHSSDPLTHRAGPGIPPAHPQRPQSLQSNS